MRTRDEEKMEQLKKILDPTMLRFVIVGVINTLFGTTVMFFCYDFLYLNYWISSGANYFFGSILSFFLNKNFTFRSQETGIAVIIKFIVNIVVCWILAYGIAQPLSGILLQNTTLTVDWKERIAMVVGMVLFTGLNYFGQRFFTFSSSKQEEMKNK